MNGWQEAVRSRLGETLTIFLGLLASSILVSLPNPAVWITGVELIAASLVMGTAFLVLNHRAKRAPDAERLGTVLDLINPSATTAVLVGLSGVALVLGFEVGLFLLALAAIIGFVGGAIGAWLVLVRPGE
ncbi:hypothetical protein [Leifsonia sp. NPDC058248]|uniref:hypothetical protein n=1 Tax=Leifsonia sp. NPDC058248 TaxID=3346402 RepID=UPI0036DECB52